VLEAAGPAFGGTTVSALATDGMLIGMEQTTHKTLADSRRRIR
jgi:hypothetical protein